MPFNLISIVTLCWQLLVLFACCSGLGLCGRFLLPINLSPLNKVLFSLLVGLFLVVLVAQNLVYLGVPVRISAWLLLAGALAEILLSRRQLFAWMRTCYSSADLRTALAVILLTATFHGTVPVCQGLEWYYGKGHFDQINYVLLAEFLKENPYQTSEQDIGLHPWLVRPVGFRDTTDQMGSDSGTGSGTIGLKKVRIGQSIITAEISTWSGVDGKGGYAATVIFFFSVLAICLFVCLRETGIGRYTAASGALLGACLPAVTRLSLDGFLSQTGILFIFPFLVSLLRHQELRARSFTVFVSLTLAYLLAVYSEIAPIGVGTLFLGIAFVRHEEIRLKRLMLLSSILLITLVNPYYLTNLIGFLAYQYSLAANAASLWDNVAPSVLTLGGWSELIFGSMASGSPAIFFDCCTLLLGLLMLAGALLLSRADKLIFCTVLFPAAVVLLYLSTRTPPSYYPIAKITLTLLPLLISLVFVVLSRFVAIPRPRPIRLIVSGLSASLVVAAAAGSVRYYSEVLNDEGLLSSFREPRFLEVCRRLEATRNKRILIFETQPLLSAWLCYHARHSDVFFDGRQITDSPVPSNLAFSSFPDLATVDLVATRERIFDLKAPGLSCVTSIDDVSGESRSNGQLRYLLGPPARLRFLALRPISATLNLQLTTTASAFPIDFFLADAQGGVLRGEVRKNNPKPLRMNLPQGFSYLELSVKAKQSSPQTIPASFPILAELDSIEISEITFGPGG